MGDGSGGGGRGGSDGGEGGTREVSCIPRGAGHTSKMLSRPETWQGQASYEGVGEGGGA